MITDAKPLFHPPDDSAGSAMERVIEFTEAILFDMSLFDLRIGHKK